MSNTQSPHLSYLKGYGTIDVRVTLGAGAALLAQRRIITGSKPIAEIVIDFDLHADTGSELEVVMDVTRIELISVSGLTIASRPRHFNDHQLQTFRATSLPMKSKVGVAGPAGVETTGKAGHLLYGPYIDLHRGTYRASARLSGARAGASVVEVVGGANRTTLAQRSLHRADLAAGFVALDFDTDETLKNVEVRVSVNRWAKFAVSEVSVEQI